MNNMDVKNMSWQNNDDNCILNAVVGWNVQRFVCVMKDHTIQTFTSIFDETYDGEIVQHIDCMDDNYGIDDIVMWIEVPEI